MGTGSIHFDHLRNEQSNFAALDRLLHTNRCRTCCDGKLLGQPVSWYGVYSSVCIRHDIHTYLENDLQFEFVRTLRLKMGGGPKRPVRPHSTVVKAAVAAGQPLAGLVGGDHTRKLYSK